MATRHPAPFTSGDDRCSGYLHTPEQGQGPFPLVFMGHGFATEWTFGTDSFIAAFTAAGWATFNFDYRRFGESQGEPRQLLDVFDQLDDWRAALATAQAHPLVDANRIVLWGSSLGGGHALSIAGERDDIAGVIAQVPHTGAADGAVHFSAWQMLQFGLHGLYDVLKSKLGLAPHRAPIFNPGGFCLLPYAGWQAEYLAIVTPGTDWQPTLPARSMLNIGDYKPVEAAHNIRCPALLIAGSLDEACTVDDIRATAAVIPDCQLEVLECDHFDVYGGAFHRQVLELQCAFIRTRFGPTQSVESMSA